MKPITKHILATIAALLAGGALAFALFAHFGVYNFGADAQHSAPVYSLLDYMRERSIELRAQNIKVPVLNDPGQTVKGAGNYNAMCVQCHLAPGMAETELSRGLYPAPPNLSKTRLKPAHAFWAVKHGIKTSGMPAWGKSMNDEEIWNMVAFLQQLPDLDAQGYRAMVAKSSGHSHAGAGAGHDEGGSGEDAHAEMGHAEGEGEHPGGMPDMDHATSPKPAPEAEHAH